MQAGFLLAFFQRKVAALISEPGIDDPELVLLHGVLTSMCQWFLKVESAGRYLSAEEAQIIWDTHLQFLALNHVAMAWFMAWLMMLQFLHAGHGVINLDRCITNIIHL